MARKAKELATQEILDSIEKRVKLTALGNSNKPLKDMAIDSINDSGLDHSVIAAGCFLAPTTISNLVETDAKKATKYPQAETIERILKFFSVELSGKVVKMKATYTNKPKSQK